MVIHLTGFQGNPWRENRLFHKQCWDRWVSTHRRMKGRHPPTPHIRHKVYAKWIKDLNVREKTVIY